MMLVRGGLWGLWGSWAVETARTGQRLYVSHGRTLCWLGRRKNAFLSGRRVSPRWGSRGPHGKLCSVSYFGQASWPAKLIRKLCFNLIMITAQTKREFWALPRSLSALISQRFWLLCSKLTRSFYLAPRCWDVKSRSQAVGAKGGSAASFAARRIFGRLLGLPN